VADQSFDDDAIVLVSHCSLFGRNPPAQDHAIQTGSLHMALDGDAKTAANASQKDKCAGRRASAAARLPVRRGLSEVEAAIYLSVPPSFFRRLVDQGVMPRPRVAGGRRIWDVEELDVAFKALPREGGDEALFGGDGGNSWADYQ
jgi:excisionase family DNA binding protein